jgi:hypothetical protein
VAEGARLESVYTGNRIVGSNPTLSATNLLKLKQLIFATTSYNQFSPYLRFQLGIGSAILTTLL